MDFVNNSCFYLTNDTNFGYTSINNASISLDTASSNIYETLWGKDNFGNGSSSINPIMFNNSSFYVGYC